MLEKEIWAIDGVDQSHLVFNVSVSVYISASDTLTAGYVEHGSRSAASGRC